jgi:hypothetical protein
MYQLGWKIIRLFSLAAILVWLYAVPSVAEDVQACVTCGAIGKLAVCVNGGVSHYCLTANGGCTTWGAC